MIFIGNFSKYIGWNIYKNKHHRLDSNSCIRLRLTVFFHIITASIAKKLGGSRRTREVIFFRHSFNVFIHGIGTIGKLFFPKKQWMNYSTQTSITRTCDVNEPRCIFSKPRANTQSDKPKTNARMMSFTWQDWTSSHSITSGDVSSC